MVPPIDTLPILVIAPVVTAPVEEVTLNLEPIDKSPEADISPVVVTSPLSATVKLVPLTFIDCEFKELDVVIDPTILIKPLVFKFPSESIVKLL